MRSVNVAFGKHSCLWGRGAFLFLVLSLCLVSSAVARGTSQWTHPLDPLSQEEIVQAVEVLKAEGHLNDARRIPHLVLDEPPKPQGWSHKPGDPIRRQAFAVIYDPAANTTFEAVVDLGTRKVVSWKEVRGVQPGVTLEDLMTNTPSIVRADPRWREALKKRGITDVENVQIDAWSAGHYGLPGEDGIRIVRAVSYYRGTSKNPYARPIEGVVAYVNLNTRKVMKVVDTGVTTVPKANAELDPKSIGKLRAAPKPLEVVQPQGVSFDLRGNEVRWQNWRFRFGMHPREGLVLYTVTYEDQERLRPVLYRASVSEMVVPYGDPGPMWFFRNVFDEGEYGLGRMAVPLEPGADYPANAVLVDAVFADDEGVPFTVPHAVSLYERDGGILWKHADYVTGHNESRRARQLVLSYVASVGNYEYGFSWIFHQDGTLAPQIELTGIVQASGRHPGSGSRPEEPLHGRVVADDVMAVHHQHFFSYRLDLDVDGESNSVVEVNVVPAPPGPHNPHRGGFVVQETALRTELEAKRQLNLASNRKWKVVNPSVKNALGGSVGYLLVPGENSVPYAAPDSSVRHRAGFVNAHLWVTQYSPEEKHAAGDYINQNKGGDGLPRWIRANRSLKNQDIVLWYTLGVTHVPRPEEWPVMPVKRVGFQLIPDGFFDRNPALDVPKAE